MTQETINKIDLWFNYYNFQFYLKTNVFHNNDHIIFTTSPSNIFSNISSIDFIVTDKQFEYLKHVIISITIDYNYKFRSLVEKHFNLDFNLDEFQSGEDAYYQWLHSGDNKQKALDYLESILIKNDRTI